MKTNNGSNAQLKLGATLSESMPLSQPVPTDRTGRGDAVDVPTEAMLRPAATDYLLGSAANARALFKSLEEARTGQLQSYTLEQLRSLALT
jgi:hypothetical protein